MKSFSATNHPNPFRPVYRAIGLILLPVVFIVLSRLADRILTDLLRDGLRGVAVLGFHVVAVLVAYCAFAAILHFASITRRVVIVHSFAAGITTIWLVFLMARSTITEGG